MNKYGTTYTFERLTFVKDSIGYEWSVVVAYKRSDGAFAVVADSGCSCNWYEEEYALDNASWFFDKAELYRRFDTAIDANFALSVAQKVQAKADLRQASV